MASVIAERAISSLFLVFSLLMSSACSSQGITLVHPQSGATMKCAASGFGIGSGWAEGFIGDCTRQYESKGYIPVDKLTPEQRSEFEQRGMMPNANGATSP